MFKHLLFVLFLFSCSWGVDKSIRKRKLQNYFSSGGYTRYLLTDIPDWINFSATGKCTRKDRASYFKMDALRRSFDLDYLSAINFQYSYNISRKESVDKKKAAGLSLKEEEQLFYRISNQIRAGVNTFRRPQHHRINLVWIDLALSEKGVMKRLKKLMDSNSMNKGHPVFISMCLSRKKMEHLIAKNFSDADVRIISFEMFSPYNVAGNLVPLFSLHLNKLFSFKQMLYLYLPGKDAPKELIGEFSLRRY